MTPLQLLADAARSAVLLGLALAAMPLLRRAPASTRRLVLATSLAAAALVPLASRAVPSWRVLPAAEIAIAGAPFAEPAGEAVPSPAVSPATAAAPRVEPAPAAPAERPFPWGSMIVAAWALGALAVLGRLAVGLARAREIVRRATPISRPVIDAAMREAGARAQVRESADVDAPAVTGVLSPVVLVPRGALAWDDARWRAVLLHELAHVKQRDCLAHVVGQIACALNWFDPLAWIAARRLRTERELAADELALSTGTRPTDYAGHLLAIATAASLEREVPSGALGMAERSELPARIEAIVRPGAPRAPASAARALTIAALSAALLGAVACVTSGTDPGPASPQPTASPTTASPASSPSGAAASPGPLADEVAGALGAPKGSVELTIDPAIQAIVDDEMKRLESEWHPQAATAIVLDPKTGEVLALAGPATAASPRVTGSTMKSLLIAAALEEGAVKPTDRFFCGKGARSYGQVTLRDAGEHGDLDVAQILVVSSNVGASHVFDKLGGAALGKWMRRFHFGEPSGIELRSPPVDPLPSTIEDGSFRGAGIAGGHFLPVATPFHMAAAYAAIANGGVYNPPTLARRAGDRPARERTPANERLFRPETAATVMAMLERVVGDEQGTGKAARVQGVRVAGKTGTWDDTPQGAQTRYYASFIGAAPAEAPRFVVLVGAVVSSDTATGGRVAAPVFARILARALAR